MKLLVNGLIFCAAATGPAWAQGATTLEVAESEQFGTHIVTGEGRPVYMFTGDTRASDAQDAEVTCATDECQAAWPFVTSEGDPEAGDQVHAEMLGTVQYDGQEVVTYNGWPLYHFARDQGADEPQGQDIESFGGEWYLVMPDGNKLERE